MEFLSSYQELKEQFPLSSSQVLFIEQSRQTIRSILKGEDPRLLLVVGPCSIHDITAARDFALQLKTLEKSVSKHFFLIMRTYLEKPRTSYGWKGFLYDPLLDDSHDIQLGLKWSRQFLLELAHLQVPAATEFLDPLTAFYFDDLISWGSIGARTSSSQIHRQLASGLSMPIGFKNEVAGHLSSAVKGVFSACQPHAYIGLNLKGQLKIVRTNGNLDSHVVLRGGETGPNYDADSISAALNELIQLQLPPRLIIDCSHQNCNKNFKNQLQVFYSSLKQVTEGNTSIRGLMLESHLYSGSQLLDKNLNTLQYGVSITDGCLDWATTAQLIINGSDYLNLNHSLTFAEKTFSSL